MEIITFIWIGLSTFLAVVWAYTKIVSVREPLKPIRYSQSHVHSIVSPFLPPQQTIAKPRNTQSSKHENNHNVRVLIMDDVAYWIKDNSFYMANISEEGIVDKESTRVVDTINMDGVQLDKMMFIIDKLREGLYDDSGGSGNK